MCSAASSRLARRRGAVVTTCAHVMFAAMGQDPTDEELFDMIAEVDSDGSGEIGVSLVSV